MTMRDFFVKSLESEKRAFLAVIDAIKDLPREKLEYRPDPKSKTGFGLAQLFPNEFGMIGKYFDTAKWDMKEETGHTCTDMTEMRMETEQNIDAAISKAKSMTDEDWETVGQAWAPMTKGEFALGLMMDLIHHRGQLSTYIRAMGGKNPSIYGPSGDVSMDELMKAA